MKCRSRCALMLFSVLEHNFLLWLIFTSWEPWNAREYACEHVCRRRETNTKCTFNWVCVLESACASAARAFLKWYNVSHLINYTPTWRGAILVAVGSLLCLPLSDNRSKCADKLPQSETSYFFLKDLFTMPVWASFTYYLNKEARNDHCKHKENFNRFSVSQRSFFFLSLSLALAPCHF